MKKRDIFCNCDDFNENINGIQICASLGISHHMIPPYKKFIFCPYCSKKIDYEKLMQESIKRFKKLFEINQKHNKEK